MVCHHILVRMRRYANLESLATILTTPFHSLQPRLLVRVGNFDDQEAFTVAFDRFFLRMRINAVTCKVVLLPRTFRSEF